MAIPPIDDDLQRQVRIATTNHIKMAGDIYGIPVAQISISFDLKGRAAGMYQVRESQRRIRYNPYLFAKYFKDNLATTVPHEVAHYVTDLLYGLGNVKPHGTEWCEVMLSLGAEPVATARYNLDGIPVRRHKRFRYQCHCSSHELSSTRHNRIRLGKAVYYCRKCRSAIKPE